MPRALANARASVSLICIAQRDQRAEGKHPNNPGKKKNLLSEQQKKKSSCKNSNDAINVVYYELVL